MTETPLTTRDPTTALILGKSNGVGLDRDAALVAGALDSCGVVSRAPAIRGLKAWFSKGGRAEIAIHLERVAAGWKRQADVHFLIPNQERFPERLLGRLKMVDHVLCKSRHAAEIFSKHHPSVAYVGFTSEDRLDESIAADYSRFFHLAGRSTLKNTAVLLDLWEKHPEWPLLTLVQHPDNAPRTVPANVELVSRYLPDQELRIFQNRSGVHLCPSLSEGWGHYIVEAMSCRAVTLVTDAPPMNELVDNGRGVVVPFNRSEPRHLGMNFHADGNALEAAIGGIIAMPEAEKAALGAAARGWFLENDRGFRRRFAEAIRRRPAGPPRGA